MRISKRNKRRCFATFVFSIKCFGLKFNETKWAQESKEGMPVLEVTVVYEMKMNLGWFELEPRKF